MKHPCKVHEAVSHDVYGESNIRAGVFSTKVRACELVGTLWLLCRAETACLENMSNVYHVSIGKAVVHLPQGPMQCKPTSRRGPL